VAYQAEQKFQESVGEFEHALELSPQAVEPLSELVKGYLAQNKLEEARTRLGKAIEKSPQHYVAYNLLGEVLLFQKKPDEAIASFRKAIEINPEWTIPYRNLAGALLAKQDKTGAVEAFKKGLEATSHAPLLATGLAALYEQTGDFDAAIGVYEDLLQRYPESPLAANNLAMLLVDHRKDPESVKKAAKLAERFKDSQNPSFLDTLGWVQYSQGQIDAAIASLENVLKVMPEAGVTHYHLGMAYLKKGDSEKAREHLEKAVASKEPYTGLEEAKAAYGKL
jgi:tetratricopeptide (TPR) repeat protein